MIALFLLPLIYRWHIECEALRYTFPTLMGTILQCCLCSFDHLGIKSDPQKMDAGTGAQEWRVTYTLCADIGHSTFNVL